MEVLFRNVENVGVSVAVALADLHHCETKMEHTLYNGKDVIHHVSDDPEPKIMRFKVKQEMQDDPEEHVSDENEHLKDQLISPYRIFMEQFMKGRENENYIEADRKGFEKWQSMSKQERMPYEFHAIALNMEYQDDMLLEVQDIVEVNTEADSAKDVKVEKVNDEAGSSKAVKVEKEP